VEMKEVSSAESRGGEDLNLIESHVSLDALQSQLHTQQVV